MVTSGSPGGDCGCASRERAGVAGPATSALPLSGPASARDGESAGPPARDAPSPPLLPRPCFSLKLWVWGKYGFAAERARAEGCWRVGGMMRLGERGRGRGRSEEGSGG